MSPTVEEIRATITTMDAGSPIAAKAAYKRAVLGVLDHLKGIQEVVSENDNDNDYKRGVLDAWKEMEEKLRHQLAKELGMTK